MNKALLRRVAQKLRRLRHEEHYDQGVFLAKTKCGTAGCIAGHIALELGYRPIPSSEVDTTFVYRKGGQAVAIIDVAALASGISEDSKLWEPYPTSDWPEPYATRWDAGKERCSRIAADLLDAIADGKVRL